MLETQIDHRFSIENSNTGDSELVPENIDPIGALDGCHTAS